MFEPVADSKKEEELLVQGHLHVEQHYSITALSLTPAGDQDWFPGFYIEEPAFKIHFLENVIGEIQKESRNPPP